MEGKFIAAEQAKREVFDWGQLTWCCTPDAAQAKNLVVVEVIFFPGGSHSFHKHPRQEEVLYVIEGTVEQWVGKERRVLNSGDSAFVPADVVHASFNTSASKAKLLAILGPSVGQEGYELVDMANEAPWNTLRTEAIGTEPRA